MRGRRDLVPPPLQPASQSQYQQQFNPSQGAFGSQGGNFSPPPAMPHGAQSPWFYNPSSSSSYGPPPPVGMQGMPPPLPQQRLPGGPGQPQEGYYGGGQYGGPRAPPGYYAGQQDCCACFGPPGQPCCGDLCCVGPGQMECCGPMCCTQPGMGMMCCPLPGQPLDPFFCGSGNPDEASCTDCITSCCDWTFMLGGLLLVLSLVGLIIVLAMRSADNIFSTFGVSNTVELDEAIRPFLLPVQRLNPTATFTSTILPAESTAGGQIEAEVVNEYMDAAWTASARTNNLGPLYTVAFDGLSVTCTMKGLSGAHGKVCMENMLRANTFAVQLSAWNNARDTLYALAFVYLTITMVYAFLLHRQRLSNVEADAGQSRFAASQQQQQTKLQPSAMSEQSERERAPRGRHDRSRSEETSPQTPQEVGPQQALAGQGAAPIFSGPIELYGTPFYEFVRYAWFAVSILVLSWVCNLLISFWTFSSFYTNNTSGILQQFWSSYSNRFTASVICIAIFLCWPLCNFFLELIVWVAGLLPWMLFRTMCKPGIGQLRPDLPQHQLPGYVRADMFFVDFLDLKRLGFSRNAWIILTGRSTPYVTGCCEDPLEDHDPYMAELQMKRKAWDEQRAQYFNQYGQPPSPAGMRKGTPTRSHPNAAAAAAGNVAPADTAPPSPMPQQHHHQYAGTSTTDAHSETPTKHHRRSSASGSRQRRGSRSRHHQDVNAGSLTSGSAASGLPQRSMSIGQAIPIPLPPGVLSNTSRELTLMTAGVQEAADTTTPMGTRERRRHRRSSASVPIAAEDGGSRSRHHRKRGMSVGDDRGHHHRSQTEEMDHQGSRSASRHRSRHANTEENAEEAPRRRSRSESVSRRSSRSRDRAGDGHSTKDRDIDKLANM